MLKQYDGSLTANDAWRLSQFLMTIFRESLSDIPTLTPLDFAGSLSSIRVTFDKVSYQLSKLQSLNLKVLIKSSFRTKENY